MKTGDFRELAALHRKALVDDCLPFWERHSIDAEAGGYFTCLERDGTVFDTDKFIWLQGRQAWTFSMLHNRLERRPRWLEIARHGIEFLRRHGMDQDGNWYFSLDRSGRPLVQPYNIFSDCFAAMAFSQYALASGDGEARETALRTWRNILRRFDDPRAPYNKTVPGSRPLRMLSLPMILSNLVLEFEWMLPPEEVERIADRAVRDIFGIFLDREKGVLHDSAAPDGSHPDCFEGRVIDPGHGIEAMWFVLDIAEYRGDRALMERAADVILATLDLGWDREHGGIFYFLDLHGHPTQELDWDQKLWWVHGETLVALVKGYRLTGRRELWDWYRRVHEYTWARFPDPEHGEWFGYLNRRGEVSLTLKGGKWKGCFHVPRTLYQCFREFEKLAAAGDDITAASAPRSPPGSFPSSPG